MPIRRSNRFQVTIHPNISKLIIQQYELSEFTEQDLFNVVSEHLNSLCDNKTVEKIGDEKYKLTLKGESMLKLRKLFQLLGEPDSHKTSSEGKSWTWLKGKDQDGHDLFFSIETTDDDNEYEYSYTSDDITEINDFADLDEILVYAQEFLKYVDKANDNVD